MIRHWKAAAIITLLSILPAFSQGQSSALSLPDYVAQLDRLSAAVGGSQENPQSVPEIIRRLPEHWTVQSENRIYRVSCGWLKAGLRELAKGQSEEARCAVRDRLAALKADAQALQQPAPDSVSARTTLAGILARHEFREVHGPTLWEKWNQRLNAMLRRFLSGIFGSSSFPAISNLVAWLLVAFSIMLMAIWIFSTIKQSVKAETMQLQGSSPPVFKPWNIWVEDAHAAAAKEYWRDAVRLSYWAGISFLESKGVWKPDHARTPREYLRLLSAPSGQRDSLSSLTRIFESVWYGYAQAGPESFHESLRLLESLGCHSS